MKIEVVSSTVKGLLTERYVETVLLSFSIPIPRLKLEPFNSSSPFNFNFKVNAKNLDQVVESSLKQEWEPFQNMGSKLKI